MKRHHWRSLNRKRPWGCSGPRAWARLDDRRWRMAPAYWIPGAPWLLNCKGVIRRRGGKRPIAMEDGYLFQSRDEALMMVRKFMGVNFVEPIQ